MRCIVLDDGGGGVGHFKQVEMKSMAQPLCAYKLTIIRPVPGHYCFLDW